ncbi:MAG: hypothetical protein U9Q63_03875 [Patescibacteria group bacterium]|nr:hypothetical protein [Patescibacteria group bacterium]
MSIQETPKDRWPHITKSFHLTGEISEHELIGRMEPFNLLVLRKMLEVVRKVGLKLETDVTVLVVGSIADLSDPLHPNSDVDLLVCPHLFKVRSEFVSEVQGELVESNLFRNRDYLVEVNHKKGSVASDRGRKYAKSKLFVTPSYGDLKEPRRTFDITFLGPQGKSVDYELAFAREHELAFCVVNL